ncbi:MAG: sodium:glutamate symporter [Geosporobacter ferrireducens]|nr:sodium:glutamate symporter [Geosporobacter ferrireducens]
MLLSVHLRKILYMERWSTMSILYTNLGALNMLAKAADPPPFGPYNMLMDFALMSVLLFIAQFMRAKIKLVQNLYLPSSLLAGFMGLFLSSQFLGWLPFTNNIGSYPYMLVVVLFASLYIGNSEKQSFKKVINEVGDTFTLNMAVEFGQFGLAILFGGFILTKLFPDVHQAFALMLPAGFVGGHGYAAAIGGTLKDMAGWEEAVIIGQTFATIGLLTGILGGLVLINIATRAKATRFIKTMAQLPQSMQTGLVPKEEQISLGNQTVSPMAIDPLTWHLLLVLIASAGGYYSFEAFKVIAPKISLPMMCLSMLAGVLLQLILNALGLGQYVDKRVITRIGSSVTDYLVAFGVASIRISVVMQYAMPILIMVLGGVFFCVFYVFVIGRKLFHNFWFERSIFIYGWASGVVAMGVTLLRIVDPEFRSKTLEDYGMAYVFISVIEVFIVSMVPVFVAKGQMFSTGAVLTLIFLGLVGLTILKYGVHKGKMDELREGEAEIIEQYNRDREARQQA